MKKTSKIFLLSLFLLGVSLKAQTADLQFAVELNNGTNYDVKVQIKGSSSFNLGSSNITFNYNFSDIDVPVLLTAHNFYNGTYSTINFVTEPINGVASINIVYNGATGAGTTVNTTWTDIATVRFTTLNSAGNSVLEFRTITPNKTNIFQDNNSTLVGQGTWSALNTHPLPVELTSFSASNGKNGINLNWQTKTETNNYGFEIERASSMTSPGQVWEKIGFINGHGNSNAPIDYSYIDKNPFSGNKVFYRLKQIDNDGKFEYSKEVEVELIPNEFNLFQNYPNPFNPSTNIKFALPKTTKVTLIVYNLVGEKVATLLDESKDAGYYDVQFNSDNLSSGVYIYRLTAENFVQTKKMTLIR